MIFTLPESPVKFAVAIGIRSGVVLLSYNFARVSEFRFPSRGFTLMFRPNVGGLRCCSNSVRMSWVNVDIDCFPELLPR